MSEVNTMTHMPKANTMTHSKAKRRRRQFISNKNNSSSPHHTSSTTAPHRHAPYFRPQPPPPKIDAVALLFDAAATTSTQQRSSPCSPSPLVPRRLRSDAAFPALRRRRPCSPAPLVPRRRPCLRPAIPPVTRVALGYNTSVGNCFVQKIKRLVALGCMMEKVLVICNTFEIQQ
ncbi:PREDICTED: uncharacterized protein LOC109152495 [Ipomoea nil]|uniref:uncharacterized protein LOC109152495 n=1 Tax=Ipomoea nil TaxID=35883 RepID=UPI0009020188|nr:PREDICTED: uncharacterized protein LOC109152495 [Ipomoea nil]